MAAASAARASALLLLAAGSAALAPAHLSRPLVSSPRLRRPALCAAAALGPHDSAMTDQQSSTDVPWSKVREISGPALINTLIDPILSLIDTLFVGRLGSSLALGAVACSSELFTLCFAVSLALRESASSTISRLSGTGNVYEATRFARKTLFLALIAGVLLGFLIGGPSAPYCLALMGAGPSSALHPAALSYARVRAFGLPLGMLCSAMEGIYRGKGDTRSPLRASVYAAIINSILDPLLIFNPPFGLGWGVGGAAGATVVAQLVAFYSLFTTLLPWLRHGPGSSSSARLNEDMDAPNKSDAVAGLEGDAVKVRPLDTDALVTGVGAQPSEQAAAETIEMPPRRRRKPRQWLHRVAGQRSRGEAKAKKIGGHSALRTIGATLVRSSSVLGTWVFITSTISRRLGADAIAAHGVVLKLWLLFVLSAEAPAVAGQVLCGGRIARGEIAEARALLVRLLSASFAFSLIAMLGLTAVAGPAARLFLPGDGAVAGSAAHLFRIAARSIPLVVPTVMTEAALLGAGASYGYLAGATMLNALATVLVARLTLHSSARAWVIILFFFSLRLSAAMGRLFLSKSGGGFGRWRPLSHHTTSSS